MVKHFNPSGKLTERWKYFTDFVKKKKILKKHLSTDQQIRYTMSYNLTWNCTKNSMNFSRNVTVSNKIENGNVNLNFLK